MVLGRRGLSAILLAVAGLVFYTVFLAVLATEPSAQTNGDGTDGEVSASQNQDDQGDEGCENPEQVDTFTGTENQITPNFDITGNTFRLRYEITDLDDDPGFDSFNIRPIGEDGIGVGQSVLVFDEGSGTENILEGPGAFSLEIQSEGFEYTVTVEDCVGTNQNDGNRNNGQNRSNRNRSTPENSVIRRTVPNKPLPPTGGLPVYVMVTGSILTGTCLLGLGLVVRRGPRG